jgi:triosephosphate isomerase
VAEALTPTSIDVGAQNMHWDEKGAHTGEISPTMLAGLCRYVILGHSERRATTSLSETDAAIQRKVRAAVAADITPILCVGENLEQMERGEADAVVRGQVLSAFEGLSAAEVSRCVVAYEPIWAIGTGKAASPAGANRTIAISIRGPIAERFGESGAQALRVQYGGSVSLQNIADFMAMPEIDGALLGGAGLQPGIVDLVRLAVEAKRSG